MSALLLLAALTAPPAQAMDHAAMPAQAAPVASDSACPPEHAAMGHCTPAEPLVAGPAAGTALAPGDAPAPSPPRPDYADRVWGRDAMQASRAALVREHGGGLFRQVMIDIAEVQVRDGRAGFRFEGEGWFGGDIDRLVLKSEGEGDFGERVGDAELQALYSRAIGPYFNLQAGVRQDFAPAEPTYAAIGIEGLAPYWFEVEAHGFVSTQGDVLARIAASYDQRITQRLILQPRIELNLAAQDVPQSGVGAGLSDASLDLRLRYEIVREFAPYVGLSFEGRSGRSADDARAAGEDASRLSVVAGVRAWF